MLRQFVRFVLLVASVLLVPLVAAFPRTADPCMEMKVARWRQASTVELARVEAAKVLAQGQDDYDVLHYNLDLEIDPSAEVISGTATIRLAALTGINQVVLDLFDLMTVTEVRVEGSKVSYDHASDLLTVFLSSPISSGDQIKLEIDYSGHPTGANATVGPDAFNFDTHGGSQVVIFSFSAPYFARAWWPCKDVPGDKATARLKVTVPDTLVVASNGMLENEVDLGNGKRRFEWFESYPIATYLVSVAISNYETFNDFYGYGPTDSLEVVYYVYPEDLADAIIDFEPTVSMIEFFSGLFGEYPFLSEKYGMAEIEFGGAMENQTCTSYGSSLIRGNNTRDRVVAHELSHQWWGDMISPVDWKDIWLNEGFATYSEALWDESLGGKAAYLERMQSKKSPLGYSGTVYDPDAIYATATVYWKGSWVLHMLRGVMGDADFFAALRAYASDSRFAYKGATTADFQETCEGFYGESLAWFFNEWVYREGEPDYEYYWNQSAISGSHHINLTVRQTQTGPAFKMPVRVRLGLDSGDSTMTLWNDQRVQHYALDMPEKVDDIEFDPEEWILRTVERGVSDLKLLKVLPNPFSGVAGITFTTETAGLVIVSVYDITGARIAVLQEGTLQPDFHQFEWNGFNAAGDPVAAGVYLIRAETPQGRLQTKAVYLK